MVHIVYRKYAIWTYVTHRVMGTRARERDSIVC